MNTIRTNFCSCHLLYAMVQLLCDRKTKHILAIAVTFSLSCHLSWHHTPALPVYFTSHTNETINANDLNNDYEIVTTNYGWQGTNPSGHSRRKLTGEFFNAILSHPKHNASAWADLEQNPDPNRRVVAFMDIDTCLESNYPTYGITWTHNNVNLDINARPGERIFRILKHACVHIKRAAESPVLTANKESRLILLDCGTGYPGRWLKDFCDNRTDTNKNFKFGGGWGNVLDNDQVIIAYTGITKADARPVDIGLPIPAIMPVTLMPHERYWIHHCHDNNRGLRFYKFSFQGQGNFGRDRLRDLDNGNDVLVNIKAMQSYGPGINTTSSKLNDYADLLRNTQFAAAPRGDCLWSYRFSEIMSAGAIPVVYANDWLPPFSSTADPDRIVNWEKCALFIGEEDSEVNRTIDTINQISNDARCEMMNCALDFWDKFASSRDGWLKAILLWVNRGVHQVPKQNL